MDDLSSNPVNYGFSIWINNSLSLEFLGSFKNIDVKDNSGTSYSLIFGSLYHFSQSEIVPYIGGRVKYSQLSDGSKKYSDAGINILLGLECFFNKSISLGGEVQFDYLKTDEKYSISGNMSNANIYQTNGCILLRFYF